jgi:hypothetical protein
MLAQPVRAGPCRPDFAGHHENQNPNNLWRPGAGSAFHALIYSHCEATPVQSARRLVAGAVCGHIRILAADTEHDPEQSGHNRHQRHEPIQNLFGPRRADYRGYALESRLQPIRQRRGSFGKIRVRATSASSALLADRVTRGNSSIDLAGPLERTAQARPPRRRPLSRVRLRSPRDARSLPRMWGSTSAHRSFKLVRSVHSGLLIGTSAISP